MPDEMPIRVIGCLFTIVLRLTQLEINVSEMFSGEIYDILRVC